MADQVVPESLCRLDCFSINIQSFLNVPLSAG